MPSAMSTCASCHRPLELEIEYDEEMEDDQFPGRMSTDQGKQIVPDDVQLQCGCHFHWQCLVDSYQIAYCPNCGENITSTSTFDSEQRVICNLNNEGGMQEGIDILPILTEESYLKAYPEERKCRAFLEFCREGDVEAIVDVLNDDGEEDEEEINGKDRVADIENDSAEAANRQPADILRYQDPLGSMVSGLHLAVINGTVEVIWLLLLLASNLDHSQFPMEVKRAAEQMGTTREDQTGKIDIRTLRDSDGMTAEDIARGTVWGSPFDISLLKT